MLYPEKDTISLIQYPKGHTLNPMIRKHQIRQHEEHSNNMREMGLYHPKTVNAIKYTERLRNCPRSKKSKDTWIKVRYQY